MPEILLERKSELFEFVRTSYDRLAKEYDVVVIEGAGSAAEMNLRDRDIVNWPAVEMVDVWVILVADVDQGGVLTQVIGTMDLLASEERRRVIGNLTVTGLVYFLENSLNFS